MSGPTPVSRENRRGLVSTVLSWFDTAERESVESPGDDRIDWLRVTPFLLLHVACLAVFLVGWSPVAVGTAIALYFVRMFAITGVYHRYFSHRAYRLNRFWQFAAALLGASAVQRGPLWWAARHRHHHRYSDEPEDIHSPRWHGLFRSHMGWLMTKRGFRTDLREIPDLAKYPELRFLDRFDTLVPVVLAGALLATGAVLENVAPGLGTNAWQMFVWGFVVSTVVLFHGTCTINSLSHLIGSRRYATGDDSRNNAVLALITLGEGWHNNHHRFPGAARQGFFWWEIDITYYVLRALSLVGVVHDLRPVPARVIAEARTPDVAARD